MSEPEPEPEPEPETMPEPEPEPEPESQPQTHASSSRFARLGRLQTMTRVAVDSTKRAVGESVELTARVGGQVRGSSC